MTKILITSFAAAIFMSGCVKKLETSTEETKAEVQATNEKLKISNRGIAETADLLSRTIELTKFAAALEGFQDGSRDPAHRVVDAAVVMLQAPKEMEELLPSNLGCPGPMKYPQLKGKPNVSAISESQVPSLKGATITPATWTVLLLACETASLYLYSEANSEDTDPTKRDMIHERGVKAFDACSSVLGGRAITETAWRIAAEDKADIKERRSETLKMLFSLSRTDIFSDAERAAFKGAVEVKMKGLPTDVAGDWRRDQE